MAYSHTTIILILYGWWKNAGVRVVLACYIFLNFWISTGCLLPWMCRRVEVTGDKCTCRHITPSTDPSPEVVLHNYRSTTFCCSGILIRAWLCPAPQCITLQTALTLSCQCYLHCIDVSMQHMKCFPNYISNVFKLSTFIFSPVISQEANYFCGKVIALFLLYQSGSLLTLTWSLLFLIFIAHWK